MTVRRYLLSVLCLLLGVAPLFAQSFTPMASITTTQLTGGNLARTTRWYTFHIAEAGYVISQHEPTADHIALTRATSTLEDKDLWCFVGNNTDGYEIINKAAGPDKVLAAPATMSGTEGGTAYPLLKDRNALDGYRGKWKMTASTQLANGFFLTPVGADANNIMNNRQGKLAFWTGGADKGSTVRVAFAKQEMFVDLTTGALSRTDGNTTSSWKNRWISTATDPALTFSPANGRNNMTAAGNNISIARGRDVTSCAYNLTAGTTMRIRSFSFDFINRNHTTGIAITSGDVSMTSSNVSQHFVRTGMEEQTATFELGTDNKEIELSNFYVQIERFVPPVEPSVLVFNNVNTQVPYRIPAIATAHNGDLIAVTDYRHSGSDIGIVNNGRLDLLLRVGKDNGANWEDERVLIAGLGAQHGDNEFFTAFGDPCIVADRESDKVLVLSCAGNVSFWNGTRQRHQGIAKFLSENNGQSWSAPVDLAEQFYAPLDNSVRGPIKSMFIGSGKIHQSRYTKVGQYYRLYCSALMIDVNGVTCCYIYYSDDFGTTWKLLGDINTPPIPVKGDEPKAEELPDGSVLCSSRTFDRNPGGRYFNIFRFTNTAEGKGVWGNVAYSGASTNGTVANNNATNGEIMILPVVRQSDQRPVYLALQSIPLGPERNNVVIYYKELDSFEDYKTPALFASNWNGYHQASYVGSAYSTMTLQKDHNLGFFYEEAAPGGHSGGYNMVYKNYSIDYITGNRYVHNGTLAEADRLRHDLEHMKDALAAEIAALEGRAGATGYFSVPADVRTEAQQALDAAATVGTETAGQLNDKVRALLTALETVRRRVATESVLPQAGDKVKLLSRGREGRHLAVDASLNKAFGNMAMDHRAVWQLTDAGTDAKSFYLYNPYLNRYIKALPGADYAEVQLATSQEEAAVYTLNNPEATYVSLRQTKPAGTAENRSYIHISSNGTVVRWDGVGTASHYQIAAVESFDPAWLPTLRTDVSTAATIAETRGNAINDANKGNALGQFSVDADAIAAARALAASSTSEQPALTEAIAAVDRSGRYNLPQPNRFYRFKGASSSLYIDGSNASVGRMAMSADAGAQATGVFLLTEEGKLLNYASGRYTVDTYNAGALAATANVVTFALPNGDMSKAGMYTITSDYSGGGRLFYDDGQNQTPPANWTPSVNRNGTYATPNCDWIVEEVSTLPVQLSPFGMATFYAPVAVSLPTGTKAYVAQFKDAGTLTLTEVEGTIPARTPVLIQGTAETTVTLNLDYTSTAEALAGNVLTGNLDTRALSDVLTLGRSATTQEPGFYRYTGSLLKGFRAHVAASAVPAGGGVQGLTFDFGIVSGLEAMKQLQDGAPIYDLSGRRQSHLHRGVNIVGGRKIVVQ